MFNREKTMKKILIAIAACSIVSACATPGDVARQHEYAERAHAACSMQAKYTFPDGVPAGFMADCMRSKGFAENAATGRAPTNAPCNWFYCRPETTAGK